MEHELVAMHGGTIDIESAEGQGTTFTITLLKGTAHLPQDRIEARRTLQSTALGATPYIEEITHWLPDTSEITPALIADQPSVEVSAAFPDRPRIVLADDNADMRVYIQRLLSSHFEVEAVANGTLALQAVQKRKPDLVLTDVMMPEMNGFELLRALKNDPTTASIPVIMLSARAGEEATIEGVEAGADDYLVKPFSTRELLARITTHIKIARGRYEAERHLRDLFMQAPAGVTVLQGPAYRITLANPAVLTIWGRKSEDVLNKPLFEALPEIRNQGLEPLLEGVLTTGIPYVGNELLVRLDRIGQVLTNLLTNAIKYSPRADSVVVKTVCRDNTVITSVQDFGIGIPAEKQPHVFERFFRVEGGAHATYSGLGLGLYITAEFVKRHGGSIWNESEEGKGSTFSFSLPYEQMR